MLGIIFLLLILSLVLAVPVYYLKKKQEKPDVYIWVGQGEDPFKNISE